MKTLVDEELLEPPANSVKLRKQKKIILNDGIPNALEVVIGEIWDVQDGHGYETYYVISFGGVKSATIVGQENWERFLEFLDILTDIADTTQEIPIQ